MMPPLQSSHGESEQAPPIPATGDDAPNRLVRETPPASGDRPATLERQQALLQTVVDSVSDLIFAKDRHGRFILAKAARQ
jgi:PAS domain-containing protein